MACAFNPPIIINFETESDVKEFYRDWLRNLLMSFEILNKEELQRKSYEFYSHLLTISTIYRDPLWIKLDKKILEYFHIKGELLFKVDTQVVKKTHQDRYTLKINTKYGNISHRFSSIRECKETTGLDFRKQLRRILY